MQSEMKAHWVSIVIPKTDILAFEYHGPWWITGYDADDHRIVCAAVMATDEYAAYATMANAFDDPASFGKCTRRFCEERQIGEEVGGYFPGLSDRFPAASWMVWPFPVTPLVARENRTAS